MSSDRVADWRFPTVLDETAYLDKMRQAGFTEVGVTARNFAEMEQWAELDEPPEPVQYLDELKGKVASISRSPQAIAS